MDIMDILDIIDIKAVLFVSEGEFAAIIYHKFANWFSKRNMFDNSYMLTHCESE